MILCITSLSIRIPAGALCVFSQLDKNRKQPRHDVTKLPDIHRSGSDSPKTPYAAVAQKDLVHKKVLQDQEHLPRISERSSSRPGSEINTLISQSSYVFDQLQKQQLKLQQLQQREEQTPAPPQQFTIAMGAAPPHQVTMESLERIAAPDSSRALLTTGHPDASLFEKAFRAHARSKFLRRRRFFMLSRMIKNTFHWLSDLYRIQDDNMRLFQIITKEHELVTFDKSMYRKSKPTGVGLTNAVRRILLKTPSERSYQEILTLRRIISKMKFFDQYPAHIKEKLAQAFHYEVYNEGRMILKQGHPGHSIYFIVSGGIMVRVNFKNIQTGHEVPQTVAFVGPGSYFGELALMHDIVRTSTVIVRVDGTELLRLDREDFRDILMTCHKHDLYERVQLLRSLAPLEGCSTLDLMMLNNVSQIVEFQPNTVIFGNEKKRAFQIYYLIKGQCLMIRDLWVGFSSSGRGRYPSRIPTEAEIRRHLKFRSKRRRMTIVGDVCSMERQMWAFDMILPGESHPW